MNILIKQIVCISLGIMCVLCTACGGEELIVNGVSTDEKNGSSAVGAVQYTEDDQEILSDENVDSPQTAPEHSEAAIVVYVCGAVQNSGVYELPADSRVNAALEAAGGFTEDADSDAVNLADMLEDGQKVYFPVEGEALSSDPAGADSGLVNINTADASELTRLPGIGDTRAKSIVEYRQTHGSFESKEALKSVSGIGDSIYSNLESYITVD